MMTLTMSAAQSWAALGSLFFIVGGLLWIALVAGAEAAKPVDAAVSSESTEPEEGPGASTQTRVLSILPGQVPAELDTVGAPRGADVARMVSGTPGAARPVPRRLQSVPQSAKRPHLRVVPPLAPTTSHPKKATSKVYDWSNQGL